ncbi:hypothetical protein CEXT_781401 [Caerostris extrusa]|uniref:Uncharacterized protein n=1 Tax=Caerostris extrusa TaxID=172846 RepID=A0AAV4X4N1_CAEEX|nr:hypothetical protein CEXT_781401 [Caerostris extrusa]
MVPAFSLLTFHLERGPGYHIFSQHPRRKDWGMFRKGEVAEDAEEEETDEDEREEDGEREREEVQFAV